MKFLRRVLAVDSTPKTLLSSSLRNSTTYLDTYIHIAYTYTYTYTYAYTYMHERVGIFVYIYIHTKVRARGMERERERGRPRPTQQATERNNDRNPKNNCLKLQEPLRIARRLLLSLANIIKQYQRGSRAQSSHCVRTVYSKELV